MNQPPLFGDEPRQDRIILMDLNVALSENFDQMRRYPMGTFVRDVERYRGWLVERLRSEFVVLITARESRWQDATLARMRATVDWEPDVALFNDTGLSGQYAWKVKQTLLERYVYPVYGDDRSRYLAVESNSRTRDMYRGQRIKALDAARSGTHLPGL